MASPHVTGERQEIGQRGDNEKTRTGERETAAVEPEEAELNTEVQSSENIQIEEDGQIKATRGRKRTRNEENWTRNIRKRLKNSGKACTSSRGKQVAGKELKAPCTEKCPFQCSTKFNETERQSIFQEFWASGDKREQNHFLLRHAKELPIKRARVGSMKRMRTFHYFFNTSDCKREEVCRTFFINTLDIKRELVYSVLRRQSSTGGMTPSLQGKLGNQRRTGENILQAVADHIDSLPIVESHYLILPSLCQLCTDSTLTCVNQKV